MGFWHENGIFSAKIFGYISAKHNFIFSFEFWIIAADSVHSERAKVSILVLDENDNEPDVFVAFTKPHLSIPNSGLYLLHKVPRAIYGSMIREIDFSQSIDRKIRSFE